jgi:hypothetical protein
MTSCIMNMTYHYPRMRLPSLRFLKFPIFSIVGVHYTPAKACPPAFSEKQQFSQSAALFRQPRPSQWDSSLQPGGPNCHCGRPAVLRTVIRGELHNTGREFFCCENPRDSTKNCGYFSWADGTVAYGPEAWKRWAETHGQTNWKERMALHWAGRAEAGEEIPDAVKKALEDE